jgi:DNA replication protein DnaC
MRVAPGTEGSTPTRLDQAVQRLLDNARDGDDWARAELESRRRSALANVARDLGERYSMQTVGKLESFESYHPGQAQALKKVAAYAAELPEHRKRGRGLVLFGSVGTGKDHLVAWLLYRAAGVYGFSARWLSGQELYGDVRDRMETRDTESSLFASLCEPDILAMSDPLPPRGDPTDWNLSQLYRLVDRRYRALRPTWITLNVRTEEEAYGRLSSPVFDRLREGAVMVRCFWPSYRERSQA